MCVHIPGVCGTVNDGIGGIIVEDSHCKGPRK